MSADYEARLNRVIEYFGVSPNRWRRGEWKDHGKNSKLQSNRYQPLRNYREATRVSVGYDSYIKRQWRVHMKTETNELEYQVEIRDLPEKTVAYIRHTGPYAGDGELFGGCFPESGYQCTEGAFYELYLNDPDSDPQGRHHVAIHIPVKML
jgi:hypothetical protein